MAGLKAEVARIEAAVSGGYVRGRLRRESRRGRRPMRLSAFPWVVARFDCALCPRKSQYRLARLVLMVGDAEMELERVLECVVAECPHMQLIEPRLSITQEARNLKFRSRQGSMPGSDGNNRGSFPENPACL